MYFTSVIFITLNILLLGLAIPGHGGLGPAWVALEAPWLLVVLVLLANPWRRGAIALLAVALTLLALLAFVDGLAQLSFGRRFNPLLDFALADAAFDQLAQNLGTPLAVAIVVATMAGLGLAAYLIARGLRRVYQPTLSRSTRWLLGAVLLVPLLPGVPDVASLSPRLSTPAMDLVASHWRQVRETRQALADFEHRLAQEEYALAPRALPGLAGRDVIVGFLESYGVSAIFDPRYGQRIRPRLTEMARRLDEAGIHVASHRLTSPVQGGQSWLAHATLLSGLWLATQRHYELLLNQRQPTLIDDFRRTGHHTLAVMPAITRPWPQGRQLGYDRIHSAPDIPYRGPALNWVTMPDQYTWHFFERLRRRQDTPLFAELALISSHAPWTPILPVVDWEALDEGRLFTRWKDSGVPPEQLWRDPQGVREHYARAVDYALAVVTGYAERYLDDGALLIVLGDHQPAPLITGGDASRDVPIHVLSRDPALIAPFIDAGFIRGTLPTQEPSSRRMDGFRPLLHRLFAE